MRGRPVLTEQKTKRYLTDLTDEEWERKEPLLPKPVKRRSARGTKRDPLYDALGGAAGEYFRRTSRPGKRCIGGFGASYG